MPCIREGAYDAPHDSDIRALLRVFNVHNVPLATNVATADLVIAAVGAEP